MKNVPYTVSRKAKQAKQPRGGYVNPKLFEVEQRTDGHILDSEESISSILVGSAVDYLTRFMIGNSAEEAFKISLKGAWNAGESEQAQELIEKIKGLDDESIFNACRLVGYDVCYRVGMAFYKPVDGIYADQHTIDNIKIMVNRSVSFLKEHSPVVLQGFTFKGAYTAEVTAGNADYLTDDGLWDFKVSKAELKKEQTLQLLMYYIMGFHSIHKEEFEKIKKIGIFNPRLNTVQYMRISEIPLSVIEEVSKNVIGY